MSGSANWFHSRKDYMTWLSRVWCHSRFVSAYRPSSHHPLFIFKTRCPDRSQEPSATQKRQSSEVFHRAATSIFGPYTVGLGIINRKARHCDLMKAMFLYFLAGIDEHGQIHKFAFLNKLVFKHPARKAYYSRYHYCIPRWIIYR
jgi:hypothetical protein